MTPFDQAWTLLKMARYRAGPYEIWDSNEQGGFADRSAEFEHLPPTFSQPNYVRNEETGEYEQQGMREHTQYYPIGANFGFKFKPGKAMMTPEQFHGLVASPAPESRTGQQKGILESMDRGAPIAAPILRVKPDGSDFRVDSHEGRHRMQALRDAGLGDVPVPIEIQASGYQYPYDMNNEKLREMLAGATIQPEYGRYMASEIAPGTALSPDYPETYKTGLHPLNQPFTISDFDPYWNRGEYRDTV